MKTAALLDFLIRHFAAGGSAVWVSVAASQGSAPRSPGARMVVTPRALAGTIGGGQLELRATEVARTMLADHAAGTLVPARLERFALGASVGQCCGGAVKLAFDLVTPADQGWLERARAFEEQALDWVRVVEIGGHGLRALALASALADAERPALAATLGTLAATPEGSAGVTGERVPGRSHVAELLRPPELHLALFGAGHVGRALVEVLGPLPIRASWFDQREDEFLAWTPPNVRVVATDSPEAEIADLPADSAVLITTHSHALDLELVRRCLDRGDFRFLGLVGSRSKRASFEAKLRARGYDDAQLSRLTCPVGAAGVIGKEPEVIAIAVAAQLMGLRRPPAKLGSGIAHPHSETQSAT